MPQASAQPLPVGDSFSSPRQALVQNSSLKTIEPLSSSEKSGVRTRERSALATPQSNVTFENQTLKQDEPVADAQVSEREARLQEDRQKQQLLQDQRKIQDLSARDREVRAHEQAHAAVGGQYAGAPSYEFERGPDGIDYAVAGEVSIDTGREATPEQTLRKAQVVRRAALAPAEPSPQDRRVAAMASRMEAEARSEIVADQAKEAQEARDARIESEEGEEGEEVEAPDGISDESIDSAESSSPLASSPRPQFSASNSNPFALQSPSIGSTASSQVLAFSDIDANRPGALLSNIA